MKALEIKYFLNFYKVCNFSLTYKDYLLNFYYLNAFKKRNFVNLN